MNNSQRYFPPFLLLFLSLFLVAGCGSSHKEEEPMTGRLSIGLTDAPVDYAAIVNVHFTGIEIKPESGNSIMFEFDTPMDINLLELQGGGNILIMDNIEVPAGLYNWVRLLVVAERDTLDSYIQTEADNTDSRESLWIPSGGQTGLKLHNNFIIPFGGSANFTIDFDLRKSVTHPKGLDGNYILKPSLRIVDNNEVGEIAGTVDASLLSNIVDDVETCSSSSAVYIFDADMSGDTPADAIIDDIDDIETDGISPISSATVELAQDEVYQYSAAFLSAGYYTVAFTCNAADDNADEDNSDVVTFYGVTTVEVVADTTTIHNFTAGE